MSNDYAENSVSVKTGRNALEARVVSALRSIPGAEMLVPYYRGCCYVLADSENPDRYSQAAHSLRETLEKLTRIVGRPAAEAGTSPGGANIDLNQLRALMRDFQVKYVALERYTLSGGYTHEEVQEIVIAISRYIAERPERTEQFGVAVETVNQKDPVGRLGQSQRVQDICNAVNKANKVIQDLTHHSSKRTETDLLAAKHQVEVAIMMLASPYQAEELTSVEDQRRILELLHSAELSAEGEDHLIALVGVRPANRYFALKNCSKPNFISVFKRAGVFALSADENLAKESDRTVYALPSPEVEYLMRVAAENEQAVVEVLAAMVATNNWVIQRDIIAIAAKLSPDRARLVAEVHLEKTINTWPGFIRIETYVELLGKLLGGDASGHCIVERSLRALLGYMADPKRETKLAQHDAGLFYHMLEPVRRLEADDYVELLQRIVPIYVRQEPLAAFKTLLCVFDEMMQQSYILCEKHQQFDFTEHWCPEIGKSSDIDPARCELFNALRESAIAASVKSEHAAEEVDKTLSDKKFAAYERLRHDLYASALSHYPHHRLVNEIRHSGVFGVVDYTPEFRKLISAALAVGLLAPDVVAEIISQINRCRAAGNAHLWCAQLEVFESSLTSEDLEGYRMLKAEFASKSAIHRPSSTFGTVDYVSPKSADEIELLSGADLLIYFNTWEERDSMSDIYVRVTRSSLAEVFETSLKRTIFLDAERRGFWMQNAENLKHDVFIGAILRAQVSLYISGENLAFADYLMLFQLLVARSMNPALGVPSSNRLASAAYYEICDAISKFNDLAKAGRLLDQAQVFELCELLATVATSADELLDVPSGVLYDQNRHWSLSHEAARCKALAGYFVCHAVISKSDKTSSDAMLSSVLLRTLSRPKPLCLSELYVLARNFRAVIEYAPNARPIVDALLFGADAKLRHECLLEYLKTYGPHPRDLVEMGRNIETVLSEVVEGAGDLPLDLLERIGLKVFQIYLLSGEGWQLWDSLLRVAGSSAVLRDRIFSNCFLNIDRIKIDSTSLLSERTRVMIESMIECSSEDFLKGFSYVFYAENIEFCVRVKLLESYYAKMSLQPYEAVSVIESLSEHQGAYLDDAILIMDLVISRIAIQSLRMCSKDKVLGILNVAIVGANQATKKRAIGLFYRLQTRSFVDLNDCRPEWGLGSVG